MQIDQYGRPQFSEADVVAALYNKQNILLDEVYLEDTALISQFNQAVEDNADVFSILSKIPEISVSLADYDQTNQHDWFMPEEYKSFDIVNWIYDQCVTKEQQDRVCMELELFIQLDLCNLLKYLKYLVDTMRENNVIWGVGRGSSTASYCLFLIGIHRIDSLAYDLDIHEFLK